MIMAVTGLVLGIAGTLALTHLLEAFTVRGWGSGSVDHSRSCGSLAHRGVSHLLHPRAPSEGIQ
jgi:hypothetical protein